jgi:hypothetical protein
MADGPMVAFAALELKGDDLVVLELLDDFGLHAGSREKRCAEVYLVTVDDQENVAESGFFAGFGIEFLDTQDISFGDAVLLAAGLDDCVGHGKSLEKGVRGCHGRVITSTKFLTFSLLPEGHPAL